MPNALVEDYVHDQRPPAQHDQRHQGTPPRSAAADPSTRTWSSSRGAYPRSTRPRQDDQGVRRGHDHGRRDPRADRLARPSPATVPAIAPLPLGGETDVGSPCMPSSAPSTTTTTRRPGAARMVMKRAAEHMGTRRTATTPVAGGFGGLSTSRPSSVPSSTCRPRASLPHRPRAASGAERLTFVRPRHRRPRLQDRRRRPGARKGGAASSKKFDVKVEPLTSTRWADTERFAQLLSCTRPRGTSSSGNSSAASPGRARRQASPNWR